MELFCVSTTYSNIGNTIIIWYCKRIYLVGKSIPLDNIRPQVRAFKAVLLNAKRSRCTEQLFEAMRAGHK